MQQIPESRRKQATYPMGTWQLLPKTGISISGAPCEAKKHFKSFETIILSQFQIEKIKKICLLDKTLVSFPKLKCKLKKTKTRPPIHSRPHSSPASKIKVLFQNRFLYQISSPFRRRPVLPHQRRRSGESLVLSEEREVGLCKHLLFDFSQIKKPCLKLLDQFSQKKRGKIVI